MVYLFTNCAFVLRPLHESPRHFNQKRSSSIFSSEGILPVSEAPEISCSVSSTEFLTSWEAIFFQQKMSCNSLQASRAVSYFSNRCIDLWKSAHFDFKTGRSTLSNFRLCFKIFSIFASDEKL